MLRRFLVTVLLAVSVTGLQAQETRGHLIGTATDGSGMPVASANITVRGPSLQGLRGTAADGEGAFRLIGLPVGIYDVEVSHVAYETLTLTDVAVRLGQTTALGEVALEPKAVQLAGLVVSGERPPIDPTTTTTGGHLKATTFEAVPTERNFRSITALLPQANLSYYGDDTNVSGATGLENIYHIDGLNVTNPYDATGSTDLPYNFIEEVQVKQGGYEAEFGRSLGAIVNVVTYSGGNDLSGKVFGFFTNAALVGEAKPGLAGSTVDEFSTYDVGLGVGGPILRDRLWYYVALNASREIQDVEIPTLGTHEDRLRRSMFAGKLTWRADAATDVVLSVFGDPTTHERIGVDGFWATPTSLASPDPFLNEDEYGGSNVSLRATRRLGDDLLVEADLARYQSDNNHHGATTTGDQEPLFIDHTDGAWSGGVGWTWDRRDERLSGSLKATLFRDEHTLKAGVGYEGNRVDLLQQTPWPGWIERKDTTRYEALYWIVDDDVENRVVTTFLQDSWQATERLRINTGLRWEGQYFVGAGDSVAQSITNQWQPRLGVVFTPDPDQKVSVSIGRFYQQLAMYTGFGSYVGADNRTLYYDTDPRVDPEAFDSTRVYVTPEPAHVRVEDLEGEHTDELTVGYERLLHDRYTIGVRGVYRVLRQIYVLGWAGPEAGIVYANPGKGLLSSLPDPERTYRALELTATRTDPRLQLSVSYVLSRNRGNYTGQYATDQLSAAPGNNFSLQLPEHAENAVGLLPNDRTHVVKVHGSYRLSPTLRLGGFFTWQSGTPLNELGQTWFSYSRPMFLVERGSAGRTPSIWDLNLRLTHDLPWSAGPLSRGRLILDLLHVGSPREVVAVDQWHYTGLDPETGEQTKPNLNYGAAIGHQPPMSARLGLELDF